MPMCTVNSPFFFKFLFTTKITIIIYKSRKMHTLKKINIKNKLNATYNHINLHNNASRTE